MYTVNVSMKSESKIVTNRRDMRLQINRRKYFTKILTHHYKKKGTKLHYSLTSTFVLALKILFLTTIFFAHIYKLYFWYKRFFFSCS